MIRRRRSVARARVISPPPTAADFHPHRGDRLIYHPPRTGIRRKPGTPFRHGTIAFPTPAAPRTLLSARDPRSSETLPRWRRRQQHPRRYRRYNILILRYYICCIGCTRFIHTRWWCSLYIYSHPKLIRLSPRMCVRRDQRYARATVSTTATTTPGPDHPSVGSIMPSSRTRTNPSQYQNNWVVRALYIILI